MADNLLVQNFNFSQDVLLSPPGDANAIIQSLLGASIQNYLYDIVKILLIIFLMGYLIVAVMVIKQIGLMTQTIKSSTNKYIYILGYAHLIAVICCLAFAILAL